MTAPTSRGARLVSVEETHTQVENAFTAALEAEGLLEAALERAGTERLDPDRDDGLTPILLAVSDNGSQMISRDTRTFMTLLAIAQHFGPPSTPTDQAWIESLNGTIKGEWPHLLAIEDPAVLRAELDTIRIEYNSVRLHRAWAMSPRTTNTKDGARRSARAAATAWNRPAYAALPNTAPSERINPPEDPAMLCNRSRKSDINPDTPRHQSGTPLH